MKYIVLIDFLVTSSCRAINVYEKKKSKTKTKKKHLSLKEVNKVLGVLALPVLFDEAL